MAKPNKNKQQSGKVNYQKQQRQQDKREQQQESQQRAVQPCAEGELTLQLHAHDTWFFRESRPHDAAGASELSSLFPPPIRTLAGALRTFLGESIGIDWQTLTSSQADFDFQQALGGANDLGQLQLNGPWICYKGRRLYPAPLYLMQKDQDIQRLIIGSPVRCDLGTVRLPAMPDGHTGYKNLEQRWLTASGMAKCLNNETPQVSDIVSAEDLFSHEARLGIARDNATRSVQDGKLYQTQHLRLKDQVYLELAVKNLHPALTSALTANTGSAILRLGGEGRMAGVQVQQHVEPLPFAKARQTETIVLHFMTAADFNGQLFPEYFNKTEHNGHSVWQGEINGIELMIEAAVIGKVHREGGWDMQNHQPRPVKSFIPAGSAWYCRLTQATDWQTLNQRLHGHCLGHDTAFGRGQLLLGHWQDTFNG